MQLQLISSLESLRQIEEEWNQLPLPSPLQSPAWLISWWEAYGESDPQFKLSVLAVWDEGRLAGIAPFYLKSHPYLGKTLRWLGDGRASTDHSTILVASAEDEPAIVTAVANWIVEGVTKRWQRLRLEAIDRGDRACEQLCRLLEEANLDTEWINDVGSLPAPLADDWESYLGSLSKNRRKKFRRWVRDWFDTARASVEVVTTEEQRKAMWPLLMKLHNERREGMGKEGVFTCEKFHQFHLLASEKLLADGKLYMALLRLDGEPVAIEYAPQDGHAIYAYQGGISSKGLENDAGHLSMIAMVKHAIESGRVCFDLLRGDEPYKSSWRAEHLPARTLHVRPRTVAGKLERIVGSTYRSLRDAKQQLVSNEATH